MSTKPQNIDAYLEAVDPERRAVLQHIRHLVTELEPSVTEKMSYGMPTLEYGGRALVYFTASKKHMSLYPSSWAIEAHADHLTEYETSEHAIRFTLESQLSDALIRDLVLHHVRDIDAGRN